MGKVKVKIVYKRKNIPSVETVASKAPEIYFGPKKDPQREPHATKAERGEGEHSNITLDVMQNMILS